MKVKNVGGKLVSIGVNTILPGETVSVADSYAKNPAIKCLIEHGNLAIVKDTSGGTGKKGKAEAEAGKKDSGGEA